MNSVADTTDLLHLGVEPREVSTYVGVIEGLEALTEVSMIHLVSSRQVAWLTHSTSWLSSGFHTDAFRFSLSSYQE
jgi:hypothetical protein